MRFGGGGRRARSAGPATSLVCRWDLDKTYLRSEFTTLRQLLRTAFERPEQKVDVPGVAELIRALKAAAESRGQTAPVYFVSASPPQIGKSIRAKLALERIFINLERRTPPATFRLFGPRVVPTFNYFQTAVVLAVMGRLRLEDVTRIGTVLVERSGYTARRLDNSLDDLVRRGYLTLPAAERLAAPPRA